MINGGALELHASARSLPSIADCIESTTPSCIMNDSRWERYALCLHLDRKGLNPLDLSDEGRMRMACPPLPAHLSPSDRVGIHWILVAGELARALGRDVDRRSRLLAALWDIAIYYLLPDGWRPGVAARRQFGSLREKLHAWYHGPYLESARRIETTSIEEIRTDPRRFEPAASAGLAIAHRGFCDVERDCWAFALGMRMHQEETLRPERGPAASLEDLARAFAFLTNSTDGTSRSVSRIASDGTFRIDPKQVKTTMDSLGGSLVGTKEWTVPLSSNHDREDQSEQDPAFHALVEDNRRKVAALLRDRLPDARPESGQAIALAHFIDVTTGTKSIRALAEETGFDSSGLSREFRRVRDVIRSALGA